MIGVLYFCVQINSCFFLIGLELTETKYFMVLRDPHVAADQLVIVCLFRMYLLVPLGTILAILVQTSSIFAQWFNVPKLYSIYYA